MACVNHGVYILTDLQSFREALAVLQRQVDDLDELKLAHYQKIIEHEEDVWDVVQGKVSYLMEPSSVLILSLRNQGLPSCPVYNGCIRQIHLKSVCKLQLRVVLFNC
jgi:hypothetical protein